MLQSARQPAGPHRQKVARELSISGARLRCAPPRGRVRDRRAHDRRQAPAVDRHLMRAKPP